MKKLLLNKKQIGTICFSKFFKFCAVAFVAIFCGLFCSGDSAALIIDDPFPGGDDDLPPLPYVTPKLLGFSCGNSDGCGSYGGCVQGTGTAPQVEGVQMNGLVTMPENTCTAPDGYGFAGWYNDVESETNQTAVVIPSGDSYLYMPDDINPLKYLTLCVCFQPIYTVTYSCGDGTGTAPTTNSVVYTTSYTPSSNTCTPPNGLTFAGWGVDGTNDVKAADIAFQWNYQENKTLTAQYGLPYTVSYSCGNGSGTPPSNATAVYGGEFLPAVSTCTPPNGKIFTGWLISGTNNVENSIFKWNYSSNKTLTAQYEDAKFTVITTAVDTLQFNLSASGVFYVDCGSGGTLSGKGVYGTKIDRTTLLHSDRYTCSYPSASGSKTIRFTGLATGYNKNVNMTVTSTLSFYTSSIDDEVRTDISSVSGDLSSMFPYFGSDYGESPRFVNTFSHQSNLTSLPDDVFSGYTNAGKYMFMDTFYNCTNLTGYIPPTLFAGLIANGHPSADYMWSAVFTNTQLATECPVGTTQYITGYEGTNYNTTWNGKVSCQPLVTCSYGYYLPANSDTCATCPSGKVCPGGEFIENSSTVQGLYDYAVTYSCGSGSGNAPANGVVNNGESFTPAGNTCTRPDGYIFTGWLIDGTNTVVPAGRAFTYTYSSNKTLTAQYANIETPFSLTTTSLAAGNKFQFTMSAQGTFYVDCGEGGILSGTGVSGATITKSDTKSYTYTCTYSTAGAKTIRFGGTATAYNTVTTTAAIGFSGAAAKVSSISGNLSTIFPYLGSGTGESPSFGSTFRGCTGLTSIPAGLFSGITTGADYMFLHTFRGCTGLTSIPAGLFSGITTGASGMFNYTFYDCTGLASIPSDLFSGITSGAGAMFAGTFAGCSGLTSIPADLFKNITTSADGMFADTFSGCTNITGYIPPSTFAGLIANGHPTATNMWRDTFINTKLVTSCPSGTTQYTTGYEGTDRYTTWNGKVSCEPSNALSVTYACGTGGGNPPASTTATYNASFTPAASTCTAPSGYGFNGWLVSGEGAIKPAGTAFTWVYVNDKTLTAQWTPNVINLTFDNVASPASCTFGSTFIPPTPEPRPGYIFTGWKAKPRCSLSGLDVNTNGFYRSGKSYDGVFCYYDDNEESVAMDCSDSYFTGLSNGEWETGFSYGTIKGESFCSTTNDGKTQGQTGNPGTTGGGQYCWCRITQYTPNGGNQCSFVSPSWVFAFNDNSVNTCSTFCAPSCAGNLRDDSAFRVTLFNATE